MTSTPFSPSAFGESAGASEGREPAWRRAIALAIRQSLAELHAPLPVEAAPGVRPPAVPFIAHRPELRPAAAHLPVEHRLAARDHAQPGGGSRLCGQSRSLVDRAGAVRLNYNALEPTESEANCGIDINNPADRDAAHHADQFSDRDSRGSRTCQSQQRLSRVSRRPIPESGAAAVSAVAAFRRSSGRRWATPGTIRCRPK